MSNSIYSQGVLAERSAGEPIIQQQLTRRSCPEEFGNQDIGVDNEFH